MAGGPFGAGAQPLSFTIDPSNKFAYAATNGGELRAYTLNVATGALTSVATVTIGSPLRSVTVAPSGKYAYVTTYDGIGSVRAYTINATTGALTAVAGSPFPAGDTPFSVSVDPSGKFAYVANRASNNVSVYTINAATGALTNIGIRADRHQPRLRHL